jgi:para-aminobenzoate synthetase component 1
MGLFMGLHGRVVIAPYTRSLIEWADRLAHLPGFAYLDSGDAGIGTELELITALPTNTFAAQDYSSNLTRWMTDIEGAGWPRWMRACHPRHRRAFSMAGSLLASLDYDTPASALAQLPNPTSRAFACLYHWMLVSHAKAAPPSCCSTPTVLPTRVDRSNRQFTRKPSAANGLSRSPSLLAPSISKADYRHAVERIQEYILAGDCYQVNFAQRFEASFVGDSWEVTGLRGRNWREDSRAL